ncbi:MAG: 2-oxoglutarate dehydrogenase, E2 component, dihydrolipoamide succinyltransferase [Bacteroidetes bacterium]|jgi:2-oxoglutarate dehydrogenase E2 component (dihydrolipoamide succinyltransferase)|nr:2-oxoglutarate dehydrogenase, E2 component, dihydrolipoamide succinyltransferase [Bacteroidota bacterium]
MAKVEVTMPKMGESITEGTVIVWHKEIGDEVELDETLLEIGTDKVDTEVPSPAEGTLTEIMVEEGDTVEVGTVIAMLETDPEAVGDAPADAPPAEDDETEADTAEADTPAEDTAADATADDATEPSDEAEESPAEEEMPEPKAKPVGEGRVEVVMPKMGESITEGTVIVWHKEIGDEVALDETLLEIGTDKVDTEVPSPAEGILQEILVEEGDTVEVGTVIAVLGTEAPAGEEAQAPSDDDAAADTESAAEPTQEAPAQTGTPSGDGTVREPVPVGGDIQRRGSDGRFYSPLVRSIAEEEGLGMQELESIEGSGREGRVTKEDVLSYIETREEPQAAPAPKEQEQQEREATTARSTEGQPVPSAPPAAPPADDGYDGRVDVVKMDRMRQIIADHMVRSKNTSAHVTSFSEVDVTNLVKQRERNKEAFMEREGVKLTYTPFFVQAAVDALREHPILNASVEEKEILIKKDLHVGIAVAIERKGLVAPVIRNAGQKNLIGLTHAAADLANRARNKQLQPDELQGGTFTITNIGTLGSLMGTPIINQPQVAILATGAIKKRPVVIEHPDLGDTIAIRHMMYVSLSYDHRIIDGAMGASFLQSFGQTLEALDPDAEL